MFRRLLPLFVLVPVVDLILLVWIGRRTSAGTVLALVLFSGLLGAYLAKWEGLRVLRSFRTAAAQGRLPEEGVLSGVLVLAGAALLVVPGVITDVVGILLLVPPTRRVAAAWIRRRIERRVVVIGGRAGAGRRAARDQVIEVEGRPSGHRPER